MKEMKKEKTGQKKTLRFVGKKIQNTQISIKIKLCSYLGEKRKNTKLVKLLQSYTSATEEKIMLR